GSNLKIHEVNEATTLIMEAADEDAEIIFGTVIDENLNDDVKVTVIATGLGPKEAAVAASMTSKPVAQPQAEAPIQVQAEAIVQPQPQPQPQAVVAPAVATPVQQPQAAVVSQPVMQAQPVEPVTPIQNAEPVVAQKSAAL